MAGIAADGHAAPAVQDSLEKQIQGIGALLMVLCVVSAALCPGVALGAAGAAIWRWLQRPPLWVRLVCAALPLGLLLPLQNFIVLGWLARDLLASYVPDHFVKESTAPPRPAASPSKCWRARSLWNLPS